MCTQLKLNMIQIFVYRYLYHYLQVPPFRPSLYTSSKQFGHSFTFDAPEVWNDLPDEVCGTSSVAILRRKLKTYLFTKAYPS